MKVLISLVCALITSVTACNASSKNADSPTISLPVDWYRYPWALLKDNRLGQCILKRMFQTSRSGEGKSSYLSYRYTYGDVDGEILTALFLKPEYATDLSKAPDIYYAFDDHPPRKMGVAQISTTGEALFLAPQWQDDKDFRKQFVASETMTISAPGIFMDTFSLSGSTLALRKFNRCEDSFAKARDMKMEPIE